MAGGHFSSALRLVKVECLIGPATKYSFVGTLNMIYEHFQHPLRRLLILSQTLLYCYYYEKSPKVMMRYLKLYMDLDINDTFKKHCLTVSNKYHLYRFPVQPLKCITIFFFFFK